MRSIGMLAAVTGTLVLTSACSDGGGTTPPDNQRPEANFTEVCTQLSCVFTDTSTDPDEGGTIASRSWAFGEPASAMNTSTEQNPTHAYAAAGTYLVTLTVTDDQGETDDFSKNVLPTAPAPVNTPPTAAFTFTCDGLGACTFNSSTSTDAAPGTIAIYAWTFGDGGTADVASPSHTYSVTAPTDFTVTLTVTDNDGGTDVETQTVSVSPTPNVAPTAGFAHSCAQTVCTFVSTSTDAAPGTIASSAWTFGDGGLADGNNPSHTYSVTAATEFTVTLTVTDNQGATAVATKTIAVDPAPPANQAPVARFTYSCAGAVCTFVSTSFDHGGRITGNAWTFGDGGTATEASPTHSYAVTAATQFTVTLTVTDNQGATDIESTTILLDPTAANQPPTASFTNWCYGESCIFTSTSTDPAPGAITTYAWTFGDGATEDWKKPSHVYSVTGRTTFTVTLTVTDNEGATAVATKTVTVTPLPPVAQGCYTSGKVVECVLDIPARSTLKTTLLGVNCELVEKLSTPPPIGDQLFISVCNNKPGDAIGIFGGRLDELWVYETGTQARIWFTQGDAKPGRTLNPPAGQLTGNFPDWTLSFEDGDHPGAPGEPDFTDVVVGVHATTR
jgi:PKD repeat protein